MLLLKKQSFSFSKFNIENNLIEIGDSYNSKIDLTLCKEVIILNI